MSSKAAFYIKTIVSKIWIRDDAYSAVQKKIGRKMSVSFTGCLTHRPDRNQAGRSFFAPPPLEKCVGYTELLDIVKKFGLFSENSLPTLVSHAGYGPAHRRQIRALF